MIGWTSAGGARDADDVRPLKPIRIAAICGRGWPKLQKFVSLPGMTDEPIASDTVLVQSLFGPMIAFPRDHATLQIMTFGAHTRNEVAMLCSFVDDGDLVYDVGSHIGTFAIPLAAAAGKRGRVIAIEADADNFSLLRQNLHLHELGDRVTPVLGLAGGEGVRYRKERIAEHTSATFFMPDPEGDAQPALRLDVLQEQFDGSRHIAVIKIDVEGMELAVLRSGERAIAIDRPILYVEIAAQQMARYGVAPSDVEMFLRKYNYRFFRNIGDRNSTNDEFNLVELTTLQEVAPLYDVLAIPADHARLARAWPASTSGMVRRRS
jgi:FkbM family methyltransferase